ncbi:MAG: hypothetical protein ACON42_09335 [Flavobacteriaceae bacterium]
MDLKIFFNEPCDWETLPSPVLIGTRELLKTFDFQLEKGSAPILRESLLPEFRCRGWSAEFLFYPQSKLSVTAIGFDCGLCLQTGNMSRLYADLIKLEYLFTNGVIIGGIYILPTKRAAKAMGSNIANFERLTQELTIFQQVITLPLVVFGIE